jgi:transposase InsO family protein
MPWKVSGVVELRKRFVLDYLSGMWTMAELCRREGISRPSGYELVRRYETSGGAGLLDRSRAPRRHPNQTAEAIEAAVLALRRRHPSWGPKKLRRVLQGEDREKRWPALSTIGDLLKREGLVIARRKRRHTPPYTQPFAAAAAANQVWCADFKGWFRTEDGDRIDPLTISDACSRYLLRCQAVEKTDTERVRAIFETVFREVGLPEVIHTDNGAPFASPAVAGLSRLAIWWMKLGIVPERSEPGHPEQNGRHERMHRTLKQETTSPPKANRRAQQRAFDCFRQEFNHQRPHEALGQNTPASYYQVSPRPYPARVPEPEYDSDWQVRSISKRGQFKWKDHKIFLSDTLEGERIGLQPVDDRYWTIYFARFPIAGFDSDRLKVVARPRATSLPASEDEEA